MILSRHISRRIGSHPPTWFLGRRHLGGLSLLGSPRRKRKPKKSDTITSSNPSNGQIGSYKTPSELVDSIFKGLVVSQPPTPEPKPEPEPVPEPVPVEALPNKDHVPIHVAGLSNMAKWVAHGLKLDSEKPVTLLFANPFHAHQCLDIGSELTCLTTPPYQDRTTASGFEIEVMPPPPMGDPSTLASTDPIKYLIVADSRYASVRSVLEPIKHRIDSDTVILILMDLNIYATIEKLNAFVFTDRYFRPQYWSGTSNADVSLGVNGRVFDFYNHSPGRLIIGPTAQRILGFNHSLEPTITQPNEMIRRLEEADLLDTVVRPFAEYNMDTLIALAVTATLQPLSALFRCNIRSIVRNPALFDLAKKLIIAETGPLINNFFPTRTMQDRRPKDSTVVDAIVRGAVHMGNVSNHACRMLEEIERNEEMTTIHHVNGWLVKKSRELGLPSTYNKKLVDMIEDRRKLRDHEIGEAFPGLNYPMLPEGFSIPESMTLLGL